MNPINLMKYRHQVMEAAAYLRERLPAEPEVGVLTGTGLGGIGDLLENPFACPYSRIPNFPVSTVESHPGRFLSGMADGLPLAVLQGRFHLYEGYHPLSVTFPIRVLQALGVKTLILSNAAGGLNPDYSDGEMMLIADHINLTGETPLVGPNTDGWGERFPDMTAAYDPGLGDIFRQAALDTGIEVREGVYVGLKGPSLETPAEVRYLRTIGADAVGFSTVQEVIAAIHGRMRVLGVSIITNVHRPEAPEPATLEGVIAVANRAAPQLTHLIGQTLSAL